MKTYQKFFHEVDNASLDISTNSITVTDSKSSDSITITGLCKKRLARELRYWLSHVRYSHYETADERESVLLELNRMQEVLAETIDSLTPKEVAS
jgi:hypothetical protein